MTIYPLPPDGELPPVLLDIAGHEPGVNERLSTGNHGLGHLIYLGGNAVLDEFYSQHHNAVKTHFSWASKGAIIRMRTVTEHFAVGISAPTIQAIHLVKQRDTISVRWLTPHWLLLNLGITIQNHLWVRLLGGWYKYGPCQITIDTTNTRIQYELAGDLWKTCKKTFRFKPTAAGVVTEENHGIAFT